ncbi:hypothetical protein AXE80_13910 [Wenyingzhuangia fucanilytica]|uniref:Outer membrane protein beta-barrel domain-containing protein n=1 Tax=Wenyingzhuangia fucanilytica TaxID=1790137 RepID=A0A1B1Y960_9FLAO|nr:porin family protein [Wenyingzhuangia fucanilytica]ANW97321.1 hypothetical protein AXE80_13910 [Wenyingzhuangia fucanilytica]
MKEPKNIERLFQEKLKDLEMTPNPAVWNKIEQSMASPKKSKKGFIWWFSGTVAALFVIGFFLFNNNTNEVNPQVATKTVIENKKNVDTILTNKNTTKEHSLPNIASNTKTDTPKNKKHLSSNIHKNKTPNNNIPTPNNFKTTNNTPKAIKNNFATAEIIKPNQNTKTDSPKNNIEQPTTIASISKKQDLADVVKKEVPNTTNPKKHWSIAPVVSELFYNTLSNKSPVDSRLDHAQKNGENSISFGLKIAYQVSKKWRVQTGIHKMDLAQTTENISIASINRSSSFANSSNNISKPTIDKNSEISNVANNKMINELVQNNTSNNQLRQSFGYIEIPIEVNYQLFETNKLQFHLVGGLSSLFLTTNNLQVENPNFSYSDGEATNLNDVNFSFNLGTAVEYHFSNKWFFNLSPMLKMQTQTFNNTDNKPYLLGVSTGVNYKF